jgi:hypothetical protein
MMYQRNQWVILIRTGQKYQVEIDYEDFVYLIGVKNPVKQSEVKAA